MIRQVTEFYCPLCGYTRGLRPNEDITICPACQNGESQVYSTSTKFPEFSPANTTIVPGPTPQSDKECPFFCKCATKSVKSCKECYTDGHWSLFLDIEYGR